MQQVTVRVPAGTSNLGPGFDCLGLALSIYNQITVGRGRHCSSHEMIQEAARKFFDATQCKAFEFWCDIAGEIPIARGLGSSVALRLGLLHALNKLAATNLSRHGLFVLGAELEGHPDNAAPASFGGFTVAHGEKVQRFDVSPRLRFILLIPNFELSTKRARRLLPPRILRADAVSNIANVSALVAAFATCNYQRLRGCFSDYLHQPFRKKLVRYLDRVIEAAEGAGALGGFLSGSGPTVCAITLVNPQKVAKAMLRASRLPDARIIITRADNDGVRVLKSAIKNPQSAIR